MASKSVWLKNEVFSWYVESQSSSKTSYKDQTRAYGLWERANSLLVENADDFHRADSISNLKRCLNQRLKFIEYVYDLKQIALNKSPKGYLEYLETFGLVRPFMLKNLMLIRNDIEHNDAQPPNLERCKELVDIVWYFLKSTDSFLTWRKDDIFFMDLTEEGDETQYGFSMRIDYNRNHEIEVSGWFPESFISGVSDTDSTEIVVETIHSKQEKWCDEGHHANKLDGDIWLIGRALLNNTIKHHIITEALQTY